MLDLALQDKKPVVVQVDALLFEQIGDVREVALAVVDVVITLVVLGCSARHLELTSWDHLVLVSFQILSTCNNT